MRRCAQGVDFDEGGILLVSDMIRTGLGIDVSVLMGANVANEVRVHAPVASGAGRRIDFLCQVAKDHFAEATVGASSAEIGELWEDLFHSPTFHVSSVLDATSKNVWWCQEQCGCSRRCATGSGGSMRRLEEHRRACGWLC